MSFATYIENLRSKSDSAKKQIAFWSSFGITAIIFVFWLASFNVFGGSNHATVAEAVNKASAPSQSLVASVGGFFGDIKNLFFAPRKVTYTDIQVSPGK
jgi:hypothetical protein